MKKREGARVRAFCSGGRPAVDRSEPAPAAPAGRALRLAGLAVLHDSRFGSHESRMADNEYTIKLPYQLTLRSKRGSSSIDRAEAARPNMSRRTNVIPHMCAHIGRG